MMLDAGAWMAVALSLRVALVAVIVALPLAFWVAQLLARPAFRGQQVLNTLVLLPLVLPPVVTGYLLLLAFGRSGPLGGLGFAFHWTGAALAAGVMAFPLMVRAIRLALEAQDPGLAEAARTLGASRLRVFLTITLPLAVPGLLAGAVLGFAKALGEFGATITFVAAIPGLTQTVPSAIYAALQVPGNTTTIVGLVAVSVVLAVGALVASEWLARRWTR